MTIITNVNSDILLGDTGDNNLISYKSNHTTNNNDAHNIDNNTKKSLYIKFMHNIKNNINF